MLLGILPNSYFTFVTAQEARAKVSLNYLQQALAHEKQERHGQDHSPKGRRLGKRCCASGRVMEEVQALETYLLWLPATWSLSM